MFFVWQMFEHIMKIDREMYWIYGNVACAGYPLEHIDTIADTGEINTNSVLYHVVYGVRASRWCRTSSLFTTVSRPVCHTSSRSAYIYGVMFVIIIIILYTYLARLYV